MPLSNAPTLLLEQAKQGNPEAIAAVINHELQPEGITAKAAPLKDGCLNLLIESAEVPDFNAIVPFIQASLMGLGIESIATVKLYGRKLGERTPAWQEVIDLEAAAIIADEAPEMADEDDLPYQEEDDEIPSDAEDLIAEGDFEDPDVPDDSEETYPLDDETSPDEPPQRPKWYQTKLAILVPLLLVVVLAGVGGLLALLKPKEEAPTNSTQATTQPQTSSPAAATPTPATTAAATPTPPTAEATPTPATAEATPMPPTAEATPTPATTAEATPTPATTAPSPPADPFREAVTNATKAANLAQTAQSQAEWNEVATLWQVASEQMKAVPSSPPQYAKAQERVGAYQQNMEIAQQKAANSQ